MPITQLETPHLPVFAVDGLPHGTGFSLAVYAKNSKVGRGFESLNNYLEERTKNICKACSGFLILISPLNEEGFYLFEKWNKIFN